MDKIVTSKTIRVDRSNPLIRIPAKMFQEIDKRKRKIPLKINYNHISDSMNINIDWKELNNERN